MGGYAYAPLPTQSGDEETSSSRTSAKSDLGVNESAMWAGQAGSVHLRSDDKSTQNSQSLPTYTSPSASSQPTSFIQRLVVVLVLITIWPLIYFLFPSYLTSPTSSSTSIDVPPLSPSFVAECNALLKAPSHTYTKRIESLVRALPPSTGWIAEPGPSAEYFLGGFASSDWWLSERPFLIHISASASSASSVEPTITLLTPAFEALRASLMPLPEEIKSKVNWVEWKENQSPYSVLADSVGEGARRFVSDGLVRHFIGDGLRDVMEEEKDAKVVQGVKEIRERKDKREVGLLRCANQFTLHAIRKTRAQMHIGITESETRAILDEELAATGLEDGEGLILFGENAALPHGSGTNRALGKRDFALIDCGGKWGGYVSDITRTFALPDSDIPQSHIEMWETVRQVQHAPYELLLSSNITSPPIHAELDKTARNLLTIKKGAKAASADPDFSVFTHRLGHGIGLEGHESPYLVQGPLGSKPVLSGHVFSLEPGIYIPADGKEDWNGIKGVGVRLEDCFVVTQDEDGKLGGEWLSGPVEKWGDI
nr:uncharacterized protein CI109_000578 [Kwoniella shandongensis]KAA5531006.1 hypothetical protein CI109_000578 [Kwoniella shandongensis]